MAINIGIGLSLKEDPQQAAYEALQAARKDIHQQEVDLAVIFTSIELADPIILKTIKTYLPDTPVIGSSGLAIISNQGIFKHGLIISLFSFPKDIYFNTACIKDIKAKGPLVAGQELGESLLYGFKGVRRDLSMVFCDGLIEGNQEFLNGLQERVGKSFPLVGASASDNLRFSKTYVYFEDQILSDAACGILWGGKLNFGLGIKHGWKPLGKPRTVTKSSGNIIYEIENQPAAKLYEEYLACNLESLKKELNYISKFYPIGIYLSGEEEYLLRNILFIGNDGSLHLQGEASENSQIRLMIGTKESCLEATHYALGEVKKDLGGNKLNILFMFDSSSRYALLGRDSQKELQIIKEQLGEYTPIAGIYTYGEQAPLRAINYQGRSYLHNQTINLLAIGD